VVVIGARDVVPTTKNDPGRWLAFTETNARPTSYEGYTKAVESAKASIKAPVLAAAVRVHAGVEAHVGAVVAGDDGARGVAQEDGARSRRLGVELVVVRHEVHLHEAVGRVVRRPAAAELDQGLVHARNIKPNTIRINCNGRCLFSRR